MLDSREPPNGDFVAFVEKIEREQLARALRPHTLSQLADGGKVVTDDPAKDKTRALSALQRLKAAGGSGAPAPLGAMIGVFLGAALIAFGLMAEGGIVLVLLGAVLLWHNLRKLRRAAAAKATASLPGQQVNQVFGQKASDAPRRHAG